MYCTRSIITIVIYYYYFRHFDFTLKSGTFGVSGLVLPGCRTAWDKSGTGGNPTLNDQRNQTSYFYAMHIILISFA